MILARNLKGIAMGKCGVLYVPFVAYTAILQLPVADKVMIDTGDWRSF